MDGQFGPVESIDAVPIDQLVGIGVVATDGVDLRAGVLCQLGDLGKDFLSPECQIPPGKVQAGHEQVGTAGGLGQVDDLPGVSGAHIGTDEEKGALGQAAAGFVHAYRRHVGTGRHGGYRQVFSEIEVGAMGFVSQRQHPMVMSQLDNGPKIRTDTVVSGVVHQNRHRIRIFPDGLLHLGNLHA